MKSKSRIARLTEGALIAALYVLLTVCGAGLASGVIQVRFAEALTVLPYFTPAAVPGLFVGCLLANLLLGSAAWDIVFGSLATLIGAVLARALRRRRFLVAIPSILSNALIVPFVLRLVYGAKEALPFLMLTVGIGELISAGVLGTLLLLCLDRYGARLFRDRKDESER